MRIRLCKSVRSGKKQTLHHASGILLCLAVLFFPLVSFGWKISWQVPSLENKKPDGKAFGKKNSLPFFEEYYIAGGFPYVFPEKSKVTIDPNVFKNGEVSLRFDLVPDAYSGGSVCLYKMLYDLKPYLKKGALQFWIKGETGMEIAWIALVDDEKSDGRKTVVRLPTMLYGGISKEWSLMTIPLRDFGSGGMYWDEKAQLEINRGFDWDKVAEFRIEVKKDDKNKSFRAWADDIVIVKELNSGTGNH
jgi:hypothetical protein